MMSVLFLVGRGLESPDVVSRLLDLQATPRKPLYTMAPDEPLVLYTCGRARSFFRRWRFLPAHSARVKATLLHLCECVCEGAGCWCLVLDWIGCAGTRATCPSRARNRAGG